MKSFLHRPKRTHSLIAHSLYCLQLNKPTLPSEVILRGQEVGSLCWWFGLGLCPPVLPVKLRVETCLPSLAYLCQGCQGVHLVVMGYKDHLEGIEELPAVA